MKKYKKTYAIHTLAEKHTTFFLGKTKVHVSFTGGQVTKNGVTPATYTTTDPIVQLAIEKSKAFADGAVTLLAKYPMQGEVKIGKNSPETEDSSGRGTADKPLPGQVTSDKPLPGQGTADKPVPGRGTADKPVPGRGTADKPEEKPEPTSEVQAEKATQAESTAEAQPKQDETGGSNPEVVEVSCKDVAKQYLQEHFGENPAPLRTIANVQECAAKYGITFSFV